MLHKVKKYLRCSGALLVALVLLVSSVAVPAKATTISSNNDNLVDLLDFNFITGSMSGGSNIISSSGSSNQYSVDLPYVSYVSYVDILFECDRSPSSVKYQYTQDLTVVNVSGNIYRAFGHVTTPSLSNAATSFIAVNFPSSTSGSRIKFLSWRVNLTRSVVSPVPTICSGRVSVGSDKTSFVMSDPNDTRIVYMNQRYEGITDEFSAFLYPDEWTKFDYIDFQLYCHASSIDSIQVTQDNNVSIPFELNYISSAVEPNNQDASVDDIHAKALYYYISVRIFLDTLDRTGEYPCISITGSFPSLGFIQVESVTGYIYQENMSQLQLFWYKLSAKLDSIFGSNDNSADNALITQEEINVSVNNQLVGAVEDWNTHIEVVETGYDMAFTKTTPSLNWLASLANGIYSGLGWFGRLYLLIGLVSVFMLVLSKSGLARKIGSGIRRSG